MKGTENGLVFAHNLALELSCHLVSSKRKPAEGASFTFHSVGGKEFSGNSFERFRLIYNSHKTEKVQNME